MDDIEEQLRAAAITHDDDRLRELMFGPDNLFAALARKEGESATQLLRQIANRLDLMHSESSTGFARNLGDWQRVRAAIEHENLLTNHRVTWLLSSQAFLFT